MTPVSLLRPGGGDRPTTSAADGKSSQVPTGRAKAPRARLEPHGRIRTIGRSKAGTLIPDIVAGALIGLLLLFASVLLLRTNQELISGRGVPPSMVSEMSGVIAA
jgi:hypothetical protein